MEDNEIEITAKGLSNLQPGFLPLPIFMEITRLSVTPIIEIVPLRKNGGNIEVLLLERPADDPYWPGQQHTPGTVLRPSDQKGSYSDAFRRIFTDELQLELKQQPVFVTNTFHQVARGSELALIFFVEIEGEPPVGTFYNSTSLPENIVATQLEFIGLSVESFSQLGNS